MNGEWSVLRIGAVNATLETRNIMCVIVIHVSVSLHELFILFVAKLTKP